MAKLLNIADSYEDDFIPTRNIKVIYHLSNILNNVGDMEKTPKMITDLQENRKLCGCEELPTSDIVNRVNELQSVKDRYLQLVSDFTANVSALEDEGKNIVEAFKSGVEDQKSFHVIRFSIRNQSGEADIVINNCEAIKPEVERNINDIALEISNG